MVCFFCLTIWTLLSHFWWNCPRTARQILSCNTLIFPVCKSDPARCCLPWSRLFVVGRRCHRLRASVWGTAGGDHLPWGVARGKNHHELPGSGQSTCHIQVTYVPHEPSIITTRCAFCVSPIVWYLSGCIKDLPALTLMHLQDLWFVCEHPAVHDCGIYILYVIYYTVHIRCLFFPHANNNLNVNTLEKPITNKMLLLQQQRRKRVSTSFCSSKFKVFCMIHFNLDVNVCKWCCLASPKSVSLSESPELDFRRERISCDHSWY